MNRITNLPAIGLGAAPLGNLYRRITDNTAAAVLQSALEHKFSYIDTAPLYGFGLSEQRIGQYLATLRTAERSVERTADSTTPVLSTKVGRCLRTNPRVSAGPRQGFDTDNLREPYFDYSYDGVMRSFESSLSRLGVDRIPIVYVHDLGRRTHGEAHTRQLNTFLDGGYRALNSLQSQGSLDAIGIGANEADICLDIARLVAIDCILVAGRYSLLDQSAARELLPLCEKQGIKVILGGVFNSGILATGTRSHDWPRYDYEHANDVTIEHTRKLETLCDDFQVPLPAAALQFAQAHPQVNSVVIGAATSEQVDRIAQLRDTPIDAEFWNALYESGLLSENAFLPQQV